MSSGTRDTLSHLQHPCKLCVGRVRGVNKIWKILECRVTESFGESMKLDVNKVNMAADLVR